MVSEMKKRLLLNRVLILEAVAKASRLGQVYKAWLPRHSIGANGSGEAHKTSISTRGLFFWWRVLIFSVRSIFPSLGTRVLTDLKMFTFLFKSL